MRHIDSWVVEFVDEFAAEFPNLPKGTRVELAALAGLLQKFGPTLGRPRVDTLKGSRHPNMKELRFSAEGGEWRVAFAFDPRRLAGDKAGVSSSRFYGELIRKADLRFESHLKQIAKGER